MASLKRTVLILDIDEVTRELYRRGLERRFQVITCVDERAAWEALETHQVDSIVLEPAALDDEEWGFVTRLRTSAHYCDVPIIVCSTLDARRRGAELGATVYLIKPVTPQALNDTLQSVFHDVAPFPSH
ncbi:MAG: response regulator [Caldilineaceae bacterium]|jgi:DNA-binding response OmpR family regulator|nr:response regulator [Caldilineaceae bacterium]